MLLRKTHQQSISPCLQLKVIECEHRLYAARKLTDSSRVRPTFTPDHLAVPPDFGRSRRVEKPATRMTALRESRRHVDDGQFPATIAELHFSPVRGCADRCISG